MLVREGVLQGGVSLWICEAVVAVVLVAVVLVAVLVVVL